jgi:hypothetical protein
MKGHSRNRDDGRTVHMRVVKAVEKVDGAGSRRADADAKLAGVFGEA